MISIALVEPEIPQNTGNIARLTVALGVELILVGPMGFRLDDRRVRRAGMDYWKDVRLRNYRDRAEFDEANRGRRLVGVDPRGAERFDEFVYRDGDILLFGKESVGLSELPPESIFIPMKPGCRSLNLSNAVAIVAYEAMKPFDGLGRREGSPAWGGTLRGE